MSNYRYYIHVACVVDDPSIQLAQDDLSVFLEDKAFFTNDLLVVNHANNYSRRCVNDCDAVIIIVGHEYGEIGQTGVSQLHLTYTNAKTKNKPILIFVSNEAHGEKRDRRLLDLIASMESQYHQHIWHFNAYGELRPILNEAFNSLNLGRGKWYCGDCCGSANHADTASHDVSENIGLSCKPELDLTAVKPTSLDEELSVECSAHVFEGGTLIEVGFVFVLTWRHVVRALLALNAPFSEPSMLRYLSELIDKAKADHIILTKHPQAHAISRHQIKKSEITRIRQGLQSAEWIVPTGQGATCIISDDLKALLTS